MQTQRAIAIVNEKGGTGKTTTAVSLSAALGELGQKVLLLDLDGQAASSRWLGVEDDDRLAEALCSGKGLTPIPDVIPGVSLAPASGKLDSVSHELRPTQGGQLRKVLSEMTGFDFIFIDCPPSLGNRLIGNALLAATHVIVPVETSILALDGLKILLTTLEDVRDGFGHNIILGGILACRFDVRTRLSRLVLNELRRALPGKVFNTVIRENVRMRECPAAYESILAFAPDSHAAQDYRALAKEILESPEAWREPAEQVGVGGLAGNGERGGLTVDGLREKAAALVRESARKASWHKPRADYAKQTAAWGQQKEPTQSESPAPELPAEDQHPQSEQSLAERLYPSDAPTTEPPAGTMATSAAASVGADSAPPTPPETESVVSTPPETESAAPTPPETESAVPRAVEELETFVNGLEAAERHLEMEKETTPPSTPTGPDGAPAPAEAMISDQYEPASSDAESDTGSPPDQSAPPPTADHDAGLAETPGTSESAQEVPDSATMGESTSDGSAEAPQATAEGIVADQTSEGVHTAAAEPYEPPQYDGSDEPSQEESEDSREEPEDSQDGIDDYPALRALARKLSDQHQLSEAKAESESDQEAQEGDKDREWRLLSKQP